MLGTATYFLDILFSRAHLLRTLFIFRLEKVLVQMVHNRKFQPQRFLIFWFLYTGFYCIGCRASYKPSEF